MGFSGRPEMEIDAKLKSSSSSETSFLKCREFLSSNLRLASARTGKSYRFVTVKLTVIVTVKFTVKFAVNFTNELIVRTLTQVQNTL